MKPRFRSMHLGKLGLALLTLLMACEKEAAVINSVEDEVAMTTRQLTLSSEIPAAPVNLRLDPSFTQGPWNAQLTWDAPADVDILVYRGSGTMIEAVVSLNSLLIYDHWLYNIKNLQQNTTYTFRVQAQSSTARSPMSEPFTFTTPRSTDQTPPTAPANLSITDDGCFTIANWTGSTDNLDDANQITYEIYEVQSGILVARSGLPTYYSDPNITLKHCTDYIVKARDRSGNLSGGSNVAKFVTPECAQ
jgi:hypothetical protein